MDLKTLWSLLKKTISEWSEDKASRLAAALSYYTIFSLAPLLVIAVAVAGLFFQRSSVQQQIATQVSSLIGPDASEMVVGFMETGFNTSGGIVATIFGVVTLLFGASGVFGQLQDALNTIWDVEVKPGRSIWAVVKDRFLSFTLVLGIGFLLLVSLILSAGLAAIGQFFTDTLPGGAVFWQIVNFAVSFAAIALLFALMYKYLPDVIIEWRYVWIGAIATSALFNIGRFLIGLYLGNTSATSAYGAAGALVLILLWVYYSAQILFFGAEFTQVYARSQGAGLQPAKNAQWIDEEKAVEQGLKKKETPAPLGRMPVPLTSAPTAPRGFFSVVGFSLLTVAGWAFAAYRLISNRKN